MPSASVISKPKPSRSAAMKAPTSASARTVRIVVLAALILILAYPMGSLFWITVRDKGSGGFTLANYAVLTDPVLVKATLNSLWVATGTTVMCVVIAVPMAWLAARTDLPGRRFLRNMAVLTFATPSFIAALGWVLLLGPRSGTINKFFMDNLGFEGPIFNIYSPWGIIFVLTMFLYPLVFLSLEAALENMDPQLEQAAAGLGSKSLRVFRTVTLPLATPAMLGGAFLVFVTSFTAFGVVGILGSPVGFDTIPTAVLKLLSFPPRLETAAVLALPVLVLIIGLLLIQNKLLGGRKFTTVGGKHGPRAVVTLGRWRLPAVLFVLLVLFVSLVLPFGSLLVVSFKRSVGLPFTADNMTFTENYARIFADNTFGVSVLNSTLLAVSAVVTGVVLAFLAAWLVHRHPSKSNGAVGVGMYAPLAITGATMGIALIIAYKGSPFSLGSITLLFLAYVGNVLPLTYMYIHSAMAQVGSELEEASRSLGAGSLRTWRKVSVPLLKPAVIAAALLNFVLLFRELETSIFLYDGSNSTIAVLLYSYSSQALYQRMGALAIVVLAVNSVIVILAVRWQQRR